MPPTRLRPWRRLWRTLLACGGVAAGLGAPSGAASPATNLTWSTLNAPVSPPSLKGAVAAFDSDSGNLVLFGGVTATGALSGTTWLWDGTSWRAASPNAAQPAPRQQASMAFDPARHQLILFGGIGANDTMLGDTWAWNGASWYELNAGGSGSPSPRAGAAFGYDTSRNLVLFGGTGAPNTSAAASTSAPGTTASLPSSTATGQTPSTSTSTAPTGTQPLSTQPVAVAGSGMAALDDTWSWNGSRWTQEHPAASPPARTGAAVASDTAGHAMILFGGSATPLAAAGAAPSPLGDTWEWVDGTWAPRTPAASPPARYDAVFGYDNAISASVLFGGQGTSGTLGDTWTWDGTTWSPVAVAASPGPRTSGTGGFDSADRQFVVFGGTGPGGKPLGDTAVLTSSAPVALNPTGSGPTGPTTSSSPGTGPAPPPTTAPGARITTSPGAAPTTTSTAASSGAARRVHPGDVVILHGSGFEPRTTIVITFHSVPVLVGTAIAAPNGSFSATVTVPARASAGAHSFEAAGPNAHGVTTSLWTPVRVVALTSSGGSSLTVRLSMVGIAIGIPVVSWLVLSARSHLRGHRIAGGDRLP